MPGPRRADQDRFPDRRRGQDDRNTMLPPANRDRTDARAERTAVFGKTKMCKFFILGVCAKGSNCVFAHDASEMNELPNLSRTKICKTLINTGVCDDPECTYAHNKEEIRFVEGVQPQLPPEMKPQHAGGHAHGHSRMGNGGGGQRASPHQPFNAMAGVPSMPSMPNMAGMPGMPNMLGMPPMVQNMDPAAQAMALQQWMQMLQMQQLVLAAQSQQDTKGRVGAEGYGMQGQTQGAPSGQSFLYNALFNSQQGIPAADHQAYQPMVLPEPKVAGPSTPKKGRNAAKARDVRDMANCTSCGLACPSDAEYCRSCGQQRTAGSSQRPATVPFKIKNTFIDGVADGNTPTSAPLGGMRKAQSAAAGLYSFAGDQDDGSPMSGSFAAQMPAVLETDASSGSFGVTAASAPSFSGKLAQRVNTWASDLNALAEEEAEDANRMHGQMVNAHGAASSSSQKRVQDTPFGAGQVVAEPAHADPIASHAVDHLEGRGETRRLGAGSFDDGREGWDSQHNNVVIKNTFIEFKHEPLSGMRQVQTAAGRLDLMCQE